MATQTQTNPTQLKSARAYKKAVDRFFKTGTSHSRVEMLRKSGILPALPKARKSSSR